MEAVQWWGDGCLCPAAIGSHHYRWTETKVHSRVQATHPTTHCRPWWQRCHETGHRWQAICKDHGETTLTIIPYVHCAEHNGLHCSHPLIPVVTPPSIERCICHHLCTKDQPCLRVHANHNWYEHLVQGYDMQERTDTLKGHITQKVNVHRPRYKQYKYVI